MADSQKSQIVIASVLKPVDDARLFEKIGVSLAEKGHEVHIFGVTTTGAPATPVRQHPFKPFARISLRRLFIPWKIFFACLRIKPRLVIVGTHELLTIAVLLKLFTRCKLIYDVQENYYWNILYTDAFPMIVRPFLALFVRARERLTAPMIDHFFLAEKGYQQELTFPRARYTILENKARISAGQLPERPALERKPTIHLLFTGTLAENTGVFTAIDLAVKLHVIDDRFRLTIIGWAAKWDVIQRIKLQIEPRPFIRLITDDQPIPHTRILEEIATADFGMVTYQINPSTTNSIPTKLYEYLAAQLPVLMVNHKPWVELCHKWSAAVVFNPFSYDAAELYREMMSRHYYPETPEGVTWTSEESRLLDVVGKLI